MCRARCRHRARRPGTRRCPWPWRRRSCRHACRPRSAAPGCPSRRGTGAWPASPGSNSTTRTLRMAFSAPLARSRDCGSGSARRRRSCRLNSASASMPRFCRRCAITAGNASMPNSPAAPGCRNRLAGGGMRAHRDVALDQLALRVEVVDRRAVLVAHPEAAVARRRRCLRSRRPADRAGSPCRTGPPALRRCRPGWRRRESPCSAGR